MRTAIIAACAGTILLAGCAHVPGFPYTGQSSANPGGSGTSGTSVTATCRMGYVNAPAGSGVPLADKTFSINPSIVNTSNGDDSLSDYLAMQITITNGTATPVSEGTATVVFYDISGDEISSALMPIAQVIAPGQSMAFLADESFGSPLNPPSDAVVCQVTGWGS